MDRKGTDRFIFAVLRAFVASCWMLVFSAPGVLAKPLSLKGKEAYLPGEILVKLKEGGPSPDKVASLLKVGTLDPAKGRSFHRVLLQKGWDVPLALEQVRKDPDVLWAQPNHRYYASACPTPADVYLTTTGYDWPLVRIQAPAAWDLFPGCPPGSSSVTVAVLDTGVSPNHPDLEGANLVPGFSSFGSPSNTDDDYGHGTFVASIIAAQWTTSNTENCPPNLSTTGMAGLAPGVSLMPVKVLDGNGSGSTLSIVNGIDMAVTLGARILNLSLGGAFFDQAEKESLDRALAAGCVIVASSGNESTGLNYPAAYPPVVSVGATDNADNVTYYSNFGPGLDLVAPGGGADGPYVTDDSCGLYPFNIRVLFAPAIDVLGAVLRCPTSADPCSLAMDTADNNFGTAAGTSASAPFVSAAAALVWSMAPTLTGPQVVERLLNNCDSLNGGMGWDRNSGYGRLNLYRALVPAPTATPEITQYLKTFNSPNPFRPEEDGPTNITLAIPSPEPVELVIHDGLGELVLKRNIPASQLNDNPFNPQFKSYYLSWDGRNGAGNLVKTGVYFYRVTTPSGTGRNKIIVLRSYQ